MTLNQRTIAGETIFSGKALQTGAQISVFCSPAEADSGIVFSRSDLPGKPEFRLSGASLSSSRARRSTVKIGSAEVQTVEHFLAALWCLGIDNIRVEVSGAELPALDGSAKVFIEEINRAGVKELDAPKQYIRITEPIVIKDKERSLSIFPDDSFSVSYLIDYPLKSIGRETFAMEMDGPVFAKEVAPARTFCLKKEAEFLLKLGLGKGATTENTLVMDENGPVGTTLRFPNEPVRHKVLDLVGDLYMLGIPVLGKIVAEKSGHALNARLVKEIYKRYVKPEERKKDKGKRIKSGVFSDFLLSPLSLIIKKKKGV